MRRCFARSDVFNWIRVRRLERPRGRWLVSRVRDCGKGVGGGYFGVRRGMGSRGSRGKWQRWAQNSVFPFPADSTNAAGREASPEMRKLTFPSRFNSLPLKISCRVWKIRRSSRLRSLCSSSSMPSSDASDTFANNIGLGADSRFGFLKMPYDVNRAILITRPHLHSQHVALIMYSINFKRIEMNSNCRLILNGVR